MSEQPESVASVVMRRFAVFGGACYYASGGFHDYIGSFDTIEDAERVASATHQLHSGTDRQEDDYEWWHIVDMTERRVVKRSRCQAYGAADDDPQLDT